MLRSCFTPFLWVALLPFLTSCYTTRVQPLGKAEKVIEENLGEYLVLFPQIPSPEIPVLGITLLNYPHQKIKMGVRQQLRREKNEDRLLAAGFVLQWTSLVLAFQKGGPWSRTTIGAGLLSGATLLSRGKGGGYLGWLLPPVVEQERAKYTQTVERIAPEPVPVPGVEISARAGGRQRLLRTHTSGMAAVDLVKDFGLTRFRSDQTISLEIEIPIADYRQVHHFLSSQFLHPYYSFGATPYYADRGMAGIPSGFTKPDAVYHVIDKIGLSTYWIELEDGSRQYLKTSETPQLVYADTYQTAVAHSRPTLPLAILQLRFQDDSQDGFLEAGEKGGIHLTLVNRSQTEVAGVEIALSPSSIPDLQFTPIPHLDRLAPRASRVVIIPLQASPSATSRSHNIHIHAQGTDGIFAPSRGIILHIRAAAE